MCFIAVSYVPLLFCFGTISLSVKDYYQDDREGKLLNSANIVAGNIAKAGYLSTEQSEIQKLSYDLELSSKAKEGSYRILVLDINGMVLNDTNKTEIGKTYVIPEVIEAIKRDDKVSTHPRDKAVYAAAAIMDENSQKVGAVLIVASIEDIYEALSEIERTLLLFGVVIAGIIGVLVFFLSQLLIDPLNNVLSVVQKMSDGHLKQRINVKGYDEFSELGRAFNQMTRRLEEVEKTREEFVSNVSHELKTPLSSIKVLTESILLQENVPVETYTEFLQDINSEVDRMTNIVKDLLNLVRLDQGEVALNIRPMDLNKMVEDMLKRLYPLAEQKSIELLYEDVRKVIIDADEMKLSLAISNLVENGIKYTPSGGMVKVIVDSDHQNSFITVQDTGIGIGEEYQDKIFNRFYRVDKTRDRETGGTGLGLAITRATILLHDGSIRLSSKENEGTTFVVRLPIHYNA